MKNNSRKTSRLDFQVIDQDAHPTEAIPCNRTGGNLESVIRRSKVVFCVFTMCASFAYAQSASQTGDLVATAADLPDSPSAILTQSQNSSTSAEPQQTDGERTAREQQEQAAREIKAEEKQRIGGVLPNFNVVLNGHAAPLSSSQKFDLAFHSITDPATIGLAVIAGGYGEFSDNHTGYGHGPAGYFKRFGAAYADNVDGTLFGNAILPSLLHQDPRYYRKGTGSVASRIVYSALTAFICHGDNGRRQFNASNVLGNFIAGGISNAYYPSDERGAGLTIENASIVTVEGMIGAQLLEFSPDLTAYFHRKREARRERKAAAIKKAG